MVNFFHPVILNFLCKFLFICLGKNASNCGGSCECFVRLNNIGENETSAICIKSTRGLDVKNFEPYTLGLEHSTHYDVPETIRVAQQNGVSNLLFSNVSRAGIANPVKRAPQNVHGFGIKYLAITSSFKPHEWDWRQLNQTTIRTVHIDSTDFAPLLETALATRSNVTLTKDFIEKIASERLTSFAVTNSKIAVVERYSFRELRDLRMLSFSSNELTQFSDEIFNTTMYSLWSLDLSGNKLRSLSNRVVNLLPSLTHLKLSDNQFNSLGQGIQGNWLAFKELQFDNNPLLCEDICWVYETRRPMPKLFSLATCTTSEKHGYHKFNIANRELREYCKELEELETTTENST